MHRAATSRGALRALVIFLTLLLGAPGAAARAPAARAQGARPQSTVDVALSSGYAKLGEEVRIAIRASVQGRELGPLESIDLPEVDGIEFGRVLGPSTSSRFQTDGRGRMVSSNTILYAVPVVASRTGTFEIPRFSLRIDGKDVTVPEEPMILKVLEDIEGSRALVLDLEPLPGRVYEGQPYTFDLTLGWSKGIRPGNVMLQVPWWGRQDGVIELETQLTGAEIGFPIGRRRGEELGVRDMGVRDRDGQPFQLYLLRRRFVATRPGEVRFPRTVLEVGRGRRGEALYQVIPEFAIEVVPVPETGRPLEWTGAVGPIEVERDAKRRIIDAGDSLRFEVRYSGEGNLEFFEPPELDRVPGFERFRVLAIEDDKAPFLRTIEYELVPMGPDVAEVPAVPLSVFDPERGAFVTVATEPMEIRVRAGAAGDDPFAGLAAGGEQGRAPAVRDIQARPVIGEGEALISGGPGAGGALATLAAALVGWLGLRRLVRRRGDPDSRAVRRRRGALAALRRDLGRADGPARAAEALERFLAARTDTAPGAWIGRSSIDGASPELDAEFARLREALDRAAFQGGAPPPSVDELLAFAGRVAREVPA